MSFIQNLFTSRDNNADSATYVGQQDRLWYDPVTNALYVSDGNTAGGIAVGGGGSGNGVPGGATNTIQYNAGSGQFGGTANLVINPTTGNVSVAGNLIAGYLYGDGSNITGLPESYGNSNVASYLPTYTGNIGASNLSVTGDIDANNYVYFRGGTLIGDETDGNIFRVTSPLGYGVVIETDADISGNNWQWTFNNDGIMDTPGPVNVTGNIEATNVNATVGAEIGNIAIFNGVITLVPGSSATLIDISPNAESWAFLQIPNDAIANTNDTRLHNAAGNVEISAGQASTGGSVYNWTFGADGNTTVPAAGKLNFGTGNVQIWNDSDVARIIGTAGAAVECNGANVQGSISATEISTTMWSQDGNSESYLDVYTDHISINPGGDTAVWEFASTGNLTFPDGTVQSTAYTGGGASGLPLANGTSNFDITTANGNVTITSAETNTWTFGTNGNLTTPGNVLISGGNLNVLSIQTEGGAINIGNSGDGTFVVTDPDFTPSIQVAGEAFFITTNGAGNASVFEFGTNGSTTVAFPGNLSLGDGVDSEIINPGNNISITANTASWTFGTDGTLTTAGTVAVDSLTITNNRIDAITQFAIATSNVSTGDGTSVLMDRNGLGFAVALTQGGNTYNWGLYSDNVLFPDGSRQYSAYGNANVVANLAALGSNPISTTGNIAGGNITSNNISVNDSITISNACIMFNAGASVYYDDSQPYGLEGGPDGSPTAIPFEGTVVMLVNPSVGTNNWALYDGTPGQLKHFCLAQSGSVTEINIYGNFNRVNSVGVVTTYGIWSPFFDAAGNNAPTVATAIFFKGGWSISCGIVTAL